MENDVNQRLASILTDRDFWAAQHQLEVTRNRLLRADLEDLRKRANKREKLLLQRAWDLQKEIEAKEMEVAALRNDDDKVRVMLGMRTTQETAGSHFKKRRAFLGTTRLKKATQSILGVLLEPVLRLAPRARKTAR